MISILITALVTALLVGLIWYVCDVLPVPQPLNKIVKLIAIIVGVLVIVFALLDLGGYSVWPGPARPVRP